MELGPVQKMWIKSLKDHPERQMKGYLGNGNPENYTACCLGEGLLCLNRFHGQDLKLLFHDQIIKDDDWTIGGGFLFKSYNLLGLRSPNGEPSFTRRDLDALTVLNDSGKTWPEIAKILEENPEAYFTRSV